MFYKTTMIAATLFFAVGSAPASAIELIELKSDFLLETKNKVNRDFNDLIDMISFNGSTSHYKDITLSTSKFGYPSNNGNSIRPSEAISFYSIDQTIFLEIDLTNQSIFSITFDKSSPAVGFSVRGLANDRPTVLRFFGDSGILITEYPMVGPQNEGAGINGFLGLRSNINIKMISFTYTGTRYVNDYFGIDNVVTADLGVPEPANWAMMLVGFGAIGCILRRQSSISNCV